LPGFPCHQKHKSLDKYTIFECYCNAKYFLFKNILKLFCLFFLFLISAYQNYKKKTKKYINLMSFQDKYIFETHQIQLKIQYQTTTNTGNTSNAFK
jgi:hypothetical protein